MHFSHEEIMLQLYFDRALYIASSKKRLSFVLVVAKVSVYKKPKGGFYSHLSFYLPLFSSG